MPGITGVDTRRLTRHLRDRGAMPCAFGTAGEQELAAAAAAAPPTDGRDLVSTVTTATTFSRGDGPYRVVAYDFGIKEAMLRQLGRWPPSPWCRPRPRPTQVLDLAPDGVFLSNGPGDPAALPPIVDEIRALVAAGTTAGVRDLPRPSTAGHRPRRVDLQTSLRPPRRQPPGADAWPPGGWRSPRRTTTSPWPRTRWPEVRSPTSTSTTGWSKVWPAATVPAFSVQYHPEAGPGPTTPATCSRSSGC